MKSCRRGPRVRRGGAWHGCIINLDNMIRPASARMIPSLRDHLAVPLTKCCRSTSEKLLSLGGYWRERTRTLEHLKTSRCLSYGLETRGSKIIGTWLWLTASEKRHKKCGLENYLNLVLFPFWADGKFSSRKVIVWSSLSPSLRSQVIPPLYIA